MHLRLYEGGKKDVHLGAFFGFRRGRRFEWDEGDLLVVLGEGIGVHPTIMHDSPIKEPRPS